MKPLYDDTPSPTAPVLPAVSDAQTRRLGERLPALVYLGCCGWTSPDWIGGIYAPGSGVKRLAAEGLPAYAAHPLLRTVSLERHYRRPYGVTELRSLAASVPDDFRFILRSSMTLTDPLVRDRYGKPLGVNNGFLNPEAGAAFLSLADRVLGERCGPLLFEIGAFSRSDLKTAEARQAVIEKFRLFFEALEAKNLTGRTLALELRNPQLLTPRLMKMLRTLGVRPVIGLHAQMPSILRQIRALEHYESPDGANPDWRLSGPLLIRWTKSAAIGNLMPQQGCLPSASDPTTRAAAAALILRAVKSGMPAYFVAANRAEGSAPDTVQALAESIVRMRARESEAV